MHPPSGRRERASISADTMSRCVMVALTRQATILSSLMCSAALLWCSAVITILMGFRPCSRTLRSMLIPSSPGMTISVIISSGLYFMASSSAAKPSPTHATTFMPIFSQFIMESMPILTSSSSSAISTFITRSTSIILCHALPKLSIYGYILCHILNFVQCIHLNCTFTFSQCNVRIMPWSAV